MKYLGSLRCSSVSAFRFGFIDLTWGLGLGGAVPSRLAERFPLATGKLSPTPAPVLSRIFLSPVAFLAERPRLRVEVGPGLPVSLRVLTQTLSLVPPPRGVSVGHGVAALSPGALGCQQALGPVPSTRAVFSPGPPQARRWHTRHSHTPESPRPALWRLAFIFLSSPCKA